MLMTKAVTSAAEAGLPAGGRGVRAHRQPAPPSRRWGFDPVLAQFICARKGRDPGSGADKDKRKRATTPFVWFRSFEGKAHTLSVADLRPLQSQW
jgi:hypothetical protein